MALDTATVVTALVAGLPGIGILAWRLVDRLSDQPTSPVPGQPTLPAGVGSVVESRVGAVENRLAAIEADRQTERNEHRQDQKEDREARLRLETNLASLHAKLDALRHQAGPGKRP